LTADKIFDARNFFDGPTIPPFYRVQFGGAAGGPIRKNRTFLFANYEGIRQSQSQNFSSIVPSAAARSGQLHGADGTPVTVMVDPKIIPFLGLYPLLMRASTQELSATPAPSTPPACST